MEEAIDFANTLLPKPAQTTLPAIIKAAVLVLCTSLIRNEARLKNACASGIFSGCSHPLSQGYVSYVVLLHFTKLQI